MSSSELLSQKLEKIIGETSIHVNEILNKYIDDLNNIRSCKLDIIPVSHDSAVSAKHTLQHLNHTKPSIIFVEGPIEFNSIIQDLSKCKLPVAFQASVSTSDRIKEADLPYSAIYPIVEASAEYQSILYAKKMKIPIYFIDASMIDRINFQSNNLTHYRENNDEFPFIQSLLELTKANNYTEWWLEVAELQILDMDYDSYFEILLLLGQIMIYNAPQTVINILTFRDRFMVTQIFDHLNGFKLENAVLITGAAHAASIVNLINNGFEKVEPINSNDWKRGIIQYSLLEIDRQFGFVPGTSHEADRRWKELKSKRKKNSMELRLERVMQWSADIVNLSRNAGYISSTSDSIAIIQTLYLFINLREKDFISKYDFIDAAETCIQKDNMTLKPVAEICTTYFIKDKIGHVGYKALPPLVQDIYDRLSIVNIDPSKKIVHRVLIKFKENSEFKPASDLLWILKYLEINVVPIMGVRKLGHENKEEAWDLFFVKSQNQVIKLANEGITVERVLIKRLYETINDKQSVVSLLEALEAAILHLPHEKELIKVIGLDLRDGINSTMRFEDTEKLFQLTLDLLIFFRNTHLPNWFTDFIVKAYHTYCQEISLAFKDQTITDEAVIGILKFIFKFEIMVINEGNSRDEFDVALQLISQMILPPTRRIIALISESMINPDMQNEVRAFVGFVINSPLLLNSLGEMIHGVFLCISFAGNTIGLVIELLDYIFRKVNPQYLFEWMPLLHSSFYSMSGEYITKVQQDVNYYYGQQNVEIWYEVDPFDKEPGETKVKKTQEGEQEKIKFSVRHINNDLLTLTEFYEGGNDF